MPIEVLGPITEAQRSARIAQDDDDLLLFAQFML
jgi:hypothetical protein